MSGPKMRERKLSLNSFLTENQNQNNRQPQQKNQKIKGNTERKRYLKYSMLDRKEKDGEIERELQRWQKGEQESKTT